MGLSGSQNTTEVTAPRGACGLLSHYEPLLNYGAFKFTPPTRHWENADGDKRGLQTGSDLAWPGLSSLALLSVSSQAKPTLAEELEAGRNLNELVGVICLLKGYWRVQPA